MNRKMKEKIKKSKKVTQITIEWGMNAWAVGIIRYGAGVSDWTKEELKSIYIKTRKLMTMNGGLHLRGNVGRLYLAR